jgi:hypothetical protein
MRIQWDDGWAVHLVHVLNSMMLLFQASSNYVDDSGRVEESLTVATLNNNPE